MSDIVFANIFIAVLLFFIAPLVLNNPLIILVLPLIAFNPVFNDIAKTEPTNGIIATKLKAPSKYFPRIKYIIAFIASITSPIYGTKPNQSSTVCIVSKVLFSFSGAFSFSGSNVPNEGSCTY